MLLEQAGIAVDQHMHVGSTPLIIASVAGHPLVVTALLAKGARKDQLCEDKTVREWAQKEGHLDCVAALKMRQSAFCHAAGRRKA